jgi:hypothetical protein
MFAGGLWLQLVSVLHHDPAWLIHGTEVFLDGGQLYQDVFEVNPPLVFYLTVPPVWFARRFGLFDINVFTVYVFLLTAISLAIVWRLLRRDATLPLVVRNGFLLAAGYVLIVYPAERFGQREHLMIVLSLPYLMLLGARARGVRCATHVAIGIGAFGALGLALKPYFLVVPAVAEFYLMVRAAKYGFRRVLRPETLAVASVVLLYGMTIVAFTPTYLTTIVPFAVAVYGAGYGASLSVVLGQPQTLLLPIIVLLHLIIRRMQRAPEIGDILALGACAFFAIFVIQMKGWRYHLYPVDAMLFLLLADMVLWGLADDAPLRKVPVLSAAITGLLVLMAAFRTRHSCRLRYLRICRWCFQRLSAGQLLSAWLVLAVRHSVAAARAGGASDTFPQDRAVPARCGRRGSDEAPAGTDFCRQRYSPAALRQP